MTPSECRWYWFWLVAFALSLLGAILGSSYELRPAYIVVSLIWSCISVVGIAWNRGTRWD